MPSPPPASAHELEQGQAARAASSRREHSAPTSKGSCTWPKVILVNVLHKSGPARTRARRWRHWRAHPRARQWLARARPSGACSGRPGRRGASRRGWGRRCAAHGGEKVRGGERLKKKLTCGPHMSVGRRERSRRCILSYMKICGSASGSKSIEDVKNDTVQRSEEL